MKTGEAHRPLVDLTGLKALEPCPLPLDMLVVDHAEKVPTAN